MFSSQNESSFGMVKLRSLSSKCLDLKSLIILTYLESNYLLLLSLGLFVPSLIYPKSLISLVVGVLACCSYLTKNQKYCYLLFLLFNMPWIVIYK
jgi:hypothetical protein